MKRINTIDLLGKKCSINQKKLILNWRCPKNINLIEKRNNENGNIYIVIHKIVFPQDEINDLEKYIEYFYIQLGVNKVTFAPLVEVGVIQEKDWILTRNELENRMIRKNININLKDFANYPYATIHRYCGTNVFLLFG